MAAVLRIADAAGVDRAITGIRIMDAGGTDRVLTGIRVMDAGSVDRVMSLSGGDGPAPDGPAISPQYQTFSGKGGTRSAAFTASSTTGAPTAFQWGLLDGNGSVAAGGTTATATLSCVADPGESQTSVFFCDMTVNGEVQRATCQLTWTNTLGG